MTANSGLIVDIRLTQVLDEHKFQMNTSFRWTKDLDGHTDRQINNVNFPELKKGHTIITVFKFHQI